MFESSRCVSLWDMVGKNIQDGRYGSKNSGGGSSSPQRGVSTRLRGTWV